MSTAEARPRVVAVDWSGRRGGERRAIWLAEAVGGAIVRLECGRDREEVAGYLEQLARADPRLAVGLDFSFSLPAWFLVSRDVASADALWALADRDGEAWLAECPPPFWGRRGRPRPDMPATFRVTEELLAPVGGIRPKSSFQIGGAGSVGTGSLRGFPVLARLRGAGFRIWPFHDDPPLPVVVEVYPRLCTGAVVKSRPEARRAHLDRHAPEITGSMRRAAIAGEDAFDALFAARTMARHARELAVLPSLTDPVARLEGQVWVPMASTSRCTDDSTAGASETCAD